MLHKGRKKHTLSKVQVEMVENYILKTKLQIFAIFRKCRQVGVQIMKSILTPNKKHKTFKLPKP